MNPTTVILLGIVAIAMADEPLLEPIAPASSPIICGINEEYTCGSACDTECATLGQDCGIYSYACVSKCRCKEGFARDYRNVCIPTKYCPGNTICPKNEVYHMRIPSCPKQTTCSSLIYNAYRCDENEVPTYIPGCKCKPGYIRSGIRSKCVLPKECCREPNTVLVENPNPCPGNTCQHPEFFKCLALGKKWGCQCKNGYVKENEDSYNCIHLSACKNDTTNPFDPDLNHQV